MSDERLVSPATPTAVMDGGPGVHSVDYGVIPSTLAPEHLGTFLPARRNYFQRRLRIAKQHFISLSVLKSFMQGLSFVIPLQIFLGVICTYLCQRFGASFDCQMSLFVAPVVFPLAFSINACYQRRDKVLDDLSMFKGAALILFYCHRDWAFPAGYDHRQFCNRTVVLLTKLMSLIKVYLRADKGNERSTVLREIDECFASIASITEELRGSSLPASGPLCTRLIHSHNQMCWSFERLRLVREYRTPRSIRSFTKVAIFVLPLALSPYFVYLGKKAEATWVPYYISALVTAMYASLQTLQDNLDDPFDGIGQDDIILDELDEWTDRSLVHGHSSTAGARLRRCSVCRGSGHDQTDGSADSVSAGSRSHRPLVNETTL